jgi:hypothetical protein
LKLQGAERKQQKEQALVAPVHIVEIMGTA